MATKKDKRCRIPGCKSNKVKDDLCTKHFRKEHGAAPFGKGAAPKEKKNKKRDVNVTPPPENFQDINRQAGHREAAAGAPDKGGRGSQTLHNAVCHEGVRRGHRAARHQNIGGGIA
ncbi:MAG: hypothetical protein AB1553_01815 [Nitrospirota bacterium]